MRWLLLVSAVAVTLVDAPIAFADADADAAAAAAAAADKDEADPVVDYTLTAKLDPVAHTIHGTGTITWRNKSNAPATELWLHLYLNAFKNQKSAFLREPVGHARGSGNVHDWGYIDVRKLSLRDEGASPVDLWRTAELRRLGDEDETDARVPLPWPVAPNESITLDVEWDDKLPSIVERTGYDGSFHFAGQWFPKIARLEPDGTWAHYPFHHLAEFYADYGTYDVTVDVPERFVVGATGPVTESRVAAGRRVERHVQKSVHDFAWTAWDKFRTIAEKIDGVAVTLLYPPGYEAVAARDLATLRFAIPHYRGLYGKYPYPVLTVVHVPQSAREAGAMEYPTLITTGSPWYAPSGVDTEAELVTMHEFGHQYFYGLVATDEVSWPFLDEGVNSYAEQEGLAAWRGPASGAELWGLTVSGIAVHAVFTRNVVHDTPVAQPAHTFPSGTHYGALVYSRTAAVIETLRRVYGDRPVEAALRQYTSTWRFAHPKPDDFIAAFSDACGQQAAENLRDALFEKGWVDYVVTGVRTEHAHEAAGVYDRDGKRETVTATTKGDTWDGSVLVTRRGTLHFPVDVELTLADGSTRRLRWDGAGDWVRLHYTGTQPLRGAVIDPDHAVLLDDKLVNNYALASREPATSTMRTRERLSYWASLVVQVLAP